MSQSNIEKLHKDVERYLEISRMGKAMDTVEAMLEESKLTNLKSNLLQIRETYGYMTRFLMEGMPDDSRATMLSEMKENLMLLADTALRAEKAVDSSEYYYSTLRFNKYRNERISAIISEYGNISSELYLADAAGDEAIELRKQRQDLINRLFDTLFTSLGADSEYKELTRYLTSGYADYTVASLSISAMTLALLFYFDRGKFNSLLDIYSDCDDERIRAKAFVSLVLAIIPNERRIRRDRSLMTRLGLIADAADTRHKLLETVKAIIGSRDTERVANKMKDEVIPELMKLRPDIMKSIQEHSLDPESITENNPEWEDLLNKSGLEEKMRELSEMQSSGADLMMVTFSNLKQFPFFDKAANWFLPFDSKHPDLHLTKEMTAMIDMMSQALTSDSDLYSLAFAANHMPKTQLDMISSQLNANFEQLAEEAKTSMSAEITPDFDKEVLRNVRDYYRFFKLFRRRDGFFDPFAKPLNFISLPVLGWLLADVDALSLFGEFYFKRGYYADAMPLMLKLAEDKHDDATLWEKIGYCYQSEGEFVNALEAYSKAALLKTPGLWLTKKLAFVNRCLGNYREAAKCYAKALEMEPENVSLIMNTGNMLLESGDTTGALTHFYHALYLKENSVKVLRAIAWAELMNRNFKKASDYYKKIIAMGAQASDYLNAGHAMLLQKNNKEAVNFYRLAASSDPDGFERAFLADITVIEPLGIEKSTLQLILDITLS